MPRYSHLGLKSLTENVEAKELGGGSFELGFPLSLDPQWTKNKIKVNNNLLVNPFIKRGSTGSYSEWGIVPSCSIGISCPYTSTFIVSSILVLARPVLNVDISFLKDWIVLLILSE